MTDNLTREELRRHLFHHLPVEAQARALHTDYTQRHQKKVELEAELEEVTEEINNARYRQAVLEGKVHDLDRITTAQAAAYEQIGYGDITQNPPPPTVDTENLIPLALAWT